jgi:hypothetical protein
MFLKREHYINNGHVSTVSSWTLLSDLHYYYIHLFMDRLEEFFMFMMFLFMSDILHRGKDYKIFEYIWICICIWFMCMCVCLHIYETIIEH